jgi:hypothetical protein
MNQEMAAPAPNRYSLKTCFEDNVAVSFGGTNHSFEHNKMVKKETQLPGPGEHVDVEGRLHERATVLGLTKELKDKAERKQKRLQQRLGQVEHAQQLVEKAAAKASADAQARAETQQAAEGEAPAAAQESC